MTPPLSLVRRMAPGGTPTAAAALQERYAEVRRASLALALPLSDEDCCAQSMPDASPVKWHLAHTTWFFETFVLEPRERGFAPFHPAFRVLFNSYYNGVGDKHPRPQRGLLTRPAMAQVLEYRQDVDARMERLMAGLQGDPDPDLEALVELGLQHEQQHQELILTDVKHLLSCSPLWPAYRLQSAGGAPAGPRERQAEPSGASTLRWLRFPGGVAEIGHDARAEGAGFAFDNESPRHRVYLQPYALACRPVSTGEYLAFVEAGGYRDASLWLAEGWDWIQAMKIGHPFTGAGARWKRARAAAMPAGTNSRWPVPGRSSWRLLPCICPTTKRMRTRAGPAPACPPRRNGRPPRRHRACRPRKGISPTAASCIPALHPARPGRARTGSRRWSSCSATSGNGRSPATRPIRAFAWRTAPWANTTASSW